MIIEVQIPDEVFQQYANPAAIASRLVETAGVDIDPKLVPYTFSAQQIADLKRHFGPFKDAAALVQRIHNVGTIRVQGSEMQLTGDQIQNARVQAYFYAEGDEPGSEKEAIEQKVPKSVQKRIVQRYLDERLKEALDIVLGLF